MAGLAALTVAFTILLGIFGLQVMYRVYEKEIRHTLNLAGAILEEYPEGEQTIMKSLQDTDLTTYQTGREILSHYGYDEEQNIRENSSWQRLVKIYLGGLAGFFILALSLEGAFFFCFYKRQHRQEEALFAVLDQYFSENYDFTINTEQQRLLDNPHMTDILIRLGTNLREKTEALAEERDNTKTLVTDISHQLKTPISALKTCFTMYLEADTPEEQQEFLERSQMQMDKLESLTDSLIQISRLETSLITLQREPVRLKELLTGAVNAIYHRAAMKQISIDTYDFEDMTLNLDQIGRAHV